MPTVTFNSSGTWSVPGGVSNTDCQGWGCGGNGAAGLAGGSSHSGGGGGGAEYAEETTLDLTGLTSVSYTIGGGGSGINTSFPGTSVTVTAHAGISGSATVGGGGGSGSSNSIHYSGGSGGNGSTGSNRGGGGGGSSAGNAAAGNAGTSNSGGTGGGAGGTAPSGGGNGGAGASSATTTGGTGSVPGGGGGGGSTHAGTAGGGGAAGQITLIYGSTQSGTATLAGVGTLTASASVSSPETAYPSQILPGQAWLNRFGKGRRQVQPGKQLVTLSGTATLSGTGTLTALGGLPNPTVANQWANSYSQTSTLGPIAPALQSCVVPLTPAYSVGSGSGTATAGNWLFTIVSLTQVPSNSEAHTGVGDDIHSWWREYPMSQLSGKTRTSVSYTPNIARSAGNVYVAPDNQVVAINVLVVEIQGLGPWDTVAGTASAYAAASTSVSLSQNAGAQATFFIAGVGGDDADSGQAFAPAGWTALATQTTSNGTDGLCDNILTSAFLPSTLSNQSVSGSSSLSENLSGFILAVLVGGTSPIPAGGNPNWPYLKFEAAFGAGFNTPDSELTWTDLSNRLWEFEETTGIQYQLGSLQSTNLTMELDNFDAALSSQNASSPYYPDVTSGTPIRIRAAIGTIAGNTVNRWYVIRRNAQQWPEEIDDAYRRFSPATGTDIWAVLSSTDFTPYRGEVYADSPYAWWPCDDPLGPGGVLPTSLLNAAPGNKNPLNILLSPLGGILQNFYTLTGGNPNEVQPGIPVYAAGANSGWMYGDPASAPSTALAGGDVTASPGAASWQASQQGGLTGSYGWYLSRHDASFPALNGGITVEGWFNVAFYGSPDVAYSNVPGAPIGEIAGQPVTALTLLELATGSAPVAVLQLDTSGHLNLITYNGGTGTSNPVYSSSDLRDNAWFMVQMTLTATTWQVLVNGGATANVSGTATGMTSAWDWLIIDGDLGSGGGNSPSGLVHGGNMAVSHIAVYPAILPLSRLLAHYWAAVSGFGLLPVPSGVTVQWVPGAPPSTGGGLQAGLVSNAGPDGTLNTGAIAYPQTSGVAVTVQVVAVAPGSITSGPSAWVSQAFIQVYPPGTPVQNIQPHAGLWISWTGLAPLFYVYTSQTVGAEAEAAKVCGSGDAFTSGYGGSAAGVGIAQVSAGDGSAPPAQSVIGDTVAQRIERILGYSNATSAEHFPGRCIDQAPLLVQAALDVGGQQAGQNVQNIAISDGGLLFIDNVGKLNYWQKSHLAGQYGSPVWTLGPDDFGHAANTPYDRAAHWVLDPQRAWNAIEIQPYSPSGASLPIITPANATGVSTSQQQFGAQPFPVNSYLQSQAEMQAQANFLFQYFGNPQRRVERIRIDAATYPQAWQLVLGVNVGDVITVQDWQVGGGGTVYTYRVTEIKRTFSFGAHGRAVEASVTLTCDFEPPTYWT